MRKAAVRFDAGYPGEPLMAALEERGTHYVARVRNNAVLKRLALPAMDAVVWDALSNGAPAGEPRTWVCESSYRAGSWSRSRRVVQVVVERPGELIPRCFWLLTSMPSEEMSGEDLLALYRKRGKAEGHLGELMSVVAPGPVVDVAPQEPLPGQGDQEAREGGRRLRVQPGPPAARRFGYQIMHVQRAVLERVTGTGWSLRRLAERVLRTRRAFTVSGRRITMTTGGASAHWRMLARGLATLHGPPDSGATARRRTLPRPRRPQGRRGVSKRRRKARPSRTTTPFGPETPVFGPRNRPTCPRACPRGLRKVPQPPTLPLTRRFMNKPG